MQNAKAFLPSRVLTIVHAEIKGPLATARRASHVPHHSLAMRSLTGIPSLWLLKPYASLAEVEADLHVKAEPPEYREASVWFSLYRTDLSYRAGDMDIGRSRFIHVRVYNTRAGMALKAERDTMKIIGGCQRANIDSSFICYEIVSGGAPGRLLFLEGMRSLARLDTAKERWNAVTASLGEEAMNKIEEDQRAVYESVNDFVFGVYPEMSYLPASVAAADRKFWNG
jgi:hypothetical protein